ncbi:hypothetical protein T484DRAFT_1769453 [Baffinella frigidus]|nr:hypothetical protein T484DRAFT_1769453 [Cryptophyta sp. CCMP2293]
MQHSAKGASSVLKRKLPVRTDGSVREARLEICADPREGGAPIYCNNLEECPVCFRAGPLARLEFRREAGAEAVGAWNYVSGDRFPLRVFAVDEFGHVDTSYFSDVRVSYDHGGSTHEFTLKMQDGIVELEPLFVGVAEQAAIQIVAEAQRKRGGLQGKLNLTVQPGAWLRRPVFHPTDGGELRQGEDGPDGVLESSVEVEEFLALGVKGEAWDGSDVRLDAAAIRITHPGNVPPTQKIIQGGGLQFRFLVPAAPAVYEFGMFFPGGGGVEIERGLKVERLQGDVNLRMTSLDGLHPGKLIRSGESLKIQVTTLGHVCGSLDRRDLRFACEPAGVTVTAVAGKVRGTISLTVDDSEKEMNDVVSCKIFASSATSKDAAFLEFKYYPRFLVESETADTNRDRQRQAAKVELQKAETVLKRAVDALEGKAREVAARELPNIDAIAAQNFPELDWGAVDVIRHCEQAIVKGEEDKAELTRDGRDRQLAVEEIRGDAPLSRKLLLENNAGGINVTMPANCLGVVADFGWIDRAEEKFAPAVAALGGADLSALVFQTQREAQEWEQTAPTDELKGLRFIALDSCKEAEGISEDLWKKFARFNVQGKADFAMDIIKYDEHAMPGSGKLWQHVFVSRHPTRGWKLGGRVLARCDAQS